MTTRSSISCTWNPMDREAWQAIVHGVAKSQTKISAHTLKSTSQFLCHTHCQAYSTYFTHIWWMTMYMFLTEARKFGTWFLYGSIDRQNYYFMRHKRLKVPPGSSPFFHRMRHAALGSNNWWANPGTNEGMVLAIHLSPSAWDNALCRANT